MKRRGELFLFFQAKQREGMREREKCARERKHHWLTTGRKNLSTFTKGREKRTSWSPRRRKIVLREGNEKEL